MYDAKLLYIDAILPVRCAAYDRAYEPTLDANEECVDALAVPADTQKVPATDLSETLNA